MYLAQIKTTPSSDWTTQGQYLETTGAAQSLRWDMEMHGFRHSEMTSHIEDLANGHVLNAETGRGYRVIKDGRTDHSKVIAESREAADTFERMHGVTGAEVGKDLFIGLRAAADLLEMHDATGINLHNAPNLLAFVQHMTGTTVENNHA